MKGHGWFKMGDFGSTAPIRRICWRKERYESEGAAEAACRSLRRRGLDGGGVRPYRCDGKDGKRPCWGWHVGHATGVAKEWQR